MEKLVPAQLANFMKRFRFRGGKIRVWSVRQKGSRQEARINLVVKQTDNQRVLLKLFLSDIQEYRFQRRPFQEIPPIPEARLGYFDGAFFLNLDAFPDETNPRVMDYRNSEAYIACGSISFEITTRPGKTS